MRKSTFLALKKTAFSCCHFSEHYVNRKSDVNLLDFPMLQGGNCIRVNEPNAETSYNFFNFLCLCFGLCKSSRQFCHEGQ